ncbi:M48 family metallopeptidase [Alsobacter sp. SYSU BS001988]
MILGLRVARPPARAADPSHIEVRHNGDIFRVAVRRVSAARRFTLRVSAATGGVVLSLPARADLHTALDFAARHGGWIAARLARLPDEAPLEPGGRFPLRGVEHWIEHRPGARGTVWTETGADGRPLLVVAGAAEHAHRRILDFLKREAKRDLDHAVAVHAGALGVKAAKITLRDTRSRWGSCSSTGRLNFSWRLIFTPPFVLDYLAAHEVGHLKEMNHSARFWRIVHRLCQRTDDAEAWLKRHGAGLHRYR